MGAFSSLLAVSSSLLTLTLVFNVAITSWWVSNDSGAEACASPSMGAGFCASATKSRRSESTATLPKAALSSSLIESVRSLAILSHCVKDKAAANSGLPRRIGLRAFLVVLSPIKNK